MPVREVAHAPLPVGETGEAKRKGPIKGGGSPGLHKPMCLWVRKAGETLYRGEGFTLALRQGQRPLAALFPLAKGIVTEWPGQGFSLARCAQSA